MAISEKEVRRQIVEIGSRLWQRGYVAANDGNISVRMNPHEILTTPTGVSKGFMTEDMILRVNGEGHSLDEANSCAPSSEIKMHVEVYRRRDDVCAVVHAHPPFATAFAVAGLGLDECVLPEAVLTLGAVPVAPYATPSTHEVPDSIQPFIQHSDAVLLANHGALTLGADLVTAYHRMETLEHTACIVFRAMQLGCVNAIPDPQVRKLMEIRKRLNIPGRITIPGMD